jgi:ribosomal protein L4
MKATNKTLAVNKKYRVALNEAGSTYYYFNSLKEAEAFVRENGNGKEACVEKRTAEGYHFFQNMNMY